MKKIILMAFTLLNLAFANVKRPICVDEIEVGIVGSHHVAANLIHGDIGVIKDTQSLIFKKIYTISFDLIDGVEDDKFRTDNAFKICAEFASEDSKLLKESKRINFVGQVNQLLENKTDFGFNSTQFSCTAIFQVNMISPAK